MYHDIDHYSTPTLSNEVIRYIKDYFLWRIIFKERRIAHVLEVERKYHTEQQTLDMIHSMYNVRVSSVAEFASYVHRLGESSFVRQLVAKPPWANAAVPPAAVLGDAPTCGGST
jgi:hypothetical protein